MKKVVKKHRRENNNIPALFFVILVLTFISFIEFLIIVSLVKSNNKNSPTLTQPLFKETHLPKKKLSKLPKGEIHKNIKKHSEALHKSVSLVVAKIKKKNSKINKRPKLAIILDDWGYSKVNLHYLKEIALPLDISILPGHRFSRLCAIVAHKNGKEVMLHLPMEPLHLSPNAWEKQTIMTNMNEKQITAIIDNDLKDLPYVVGVNNHMGSKATADRRVMRIVLTKLKSYGLFFVDSVSSPSTVVEDVGRAIGIKIAKRDVFLDNSSDPEYIRSQLERAIRIAAEKGQAIAIGHDRINTLRVLAAMEEELLRKVDVVFVSKILK